MKKIFFLMTLLLALFVNTAFAANGSPTPAKKVSVQSTASVVDRARLLKTEEIAALEQQIQAVEAKHNARVLIYTAQRINGGKARDYARTVVDDVLPNKKAIICVITMGDRQWYLAANRSMKEFAVTQEYGIDYISEEMVPHLKKGRYAQAFSTYVTKSEELMDFAVKNGHPHGDEDDFGMVALGLSLIIALFAGYTVRKALIAKMSNVITAYEANEYLLEDSVNIEEQKDSFLYITTKVIPKAKSSSGGGGGSDGGSGGSGGGGSF